MRVKHRPTFTGEDGMPICCLVQGCNNPKERRNGYCDPHYWRNHKYGDPLGSGRGRKILGNTARFWNKVNKNGPVPDYAPNLGQCWMWTGYVNEEGYGCFRVNLSQDGDFFLNTQKPNPERSSLIVKVHRYSYFLVHGNYPELPLDHLCRVPMCVNPEHLEPVTPGENNRRNPNWSGNSDKLIN